MAHGHPILRPIDSPSQMSGAHLIILLITFNPTLSPCLIGGGRTIFLGCPKAFDNIFIKI